MSRPFDDRGVVGEVGGVVEFIGTTEQFRVEYLGRLYDSQRIAVDRVRSVGCELPQGIDGFDDEWPSRGPPHTPRLSKSSRTIPADVRRRGPRSVRRFGAERTGRCVPSGTVAARPPCRCAWLCRNGLPDSSRNRSALREGRRRSACCAAFLQRRLSHGPIPAAIPACGIVWEADLPGGCRSRRRR